MIDFLGILTRSLLALHPQPAPASPAIAATLLETPAAVAATPVAANDAVGKIQAFYASINHVAARFRQSVTNTTFGDTKTSDGKVYLMKPGKMRWDYFAKPRKDEKAKTKKSFLSDGTTLYVIEHDNKQVIKKNLAADLMPVAVSFLTGKGDLRTDFNAELDTTGKYGDPKVNITLKLTPKQPSAQYKALYLVAAADNYRVQQSIVIDGMGNVNQFQFFEPDFESAVSENLFKLDKNSVASYRTIDADAQGKDGKAAGGATGEEGPSLLGPEGVGQPIKGEPKKAEPKKAK
jgi:outer membrane lipoprotein-sorting protein